MRSPGLSGDEKGGKGEWMGDENVREWDGQVGREMEWENSERENFLERATMGFGGNLLLRKFSRIHNHDFS